MRVYWVACRNGKAALETKNQSGPNPTYETPILRRREPAVQAFLTRSFFRFLILVLLLKP